MPLLTMPPRLRRAKPEPEAPALQGFEFAKAPSTRAAKWTRWGWRSLLVLATALLVVVLVRDVRANNKAAAPLTTETMSTDEARAAAASFASDYLSHDPLAAPTTSQDVLRRGLASGGDVVRLSFTGSGYLATDLVVPGSVTSVDATHAVVAVQARVVIGMPGNADAATAAVTTAAPVPGRGANLAPLPPGYKVVATQWLPLSIPVMQVGSTVLVDGPGPVFSADPPPSPATAIEMDSSTTSATETWAKTLFTSYALGSTGGAYLSAPGVDMAGLSGAVTLAEVQSWALSPPGPDGVRTGTAKVSWTFAPTADLTTAQLYTVTTTTSDNRWYATALGATVTPSSSN